MTNRVTTSILAARLLVAPIMVVGVLAYGPGLSSADGARESPQASTAPASRAPLHAQPPGPLPKAWTGHALVPTSTRAILTGEINARDQRTRFKFQYGLTLPYAHTSEVGEREVVGHVTDGVAEVISQLKPGATYHFRIIAFNKYGFVTGRDRTFRTLKGNESS
jgi:hypothetical protein